VEEAFAELGQQLGRTAEEVAGDAFRLVNASMTDGVRRTTASRGLNPSDLTMLAYGGNGPAFAGVQAEELNIDRVLVPKASPTFSALGTLVADPTIDEERSLIAGVEDLPIASLHTLWSELAERARGFLSDAGFAQSEIAASYQLNMRYPGQNFSLAFEVHHGAIGDLGWLDDTIGERALSLFNARHIEEYGHIREHELPEVTGVRLLSRVATLKPAALGGFTAPNRAARPASTRRINLGAGYAETPVHTGNALSPGHMVQGPAVIAEDFTTIVVYPGWTALVDDAGDYELRRG
jgi:N-methylhydantoinase A